ncbi:MAG: hypothetical protein OQL28_00575 [Sedimenticola sp.]|nr:hypothetical protein [Sedimenticola sp.]
MEFFRHAPSQTSVAELQALLTLPRLPELCASIDTLQAQEDENHGAIYCLWGAFRIRRETIRNGIRFTLPDCPNALAWTVTLESGHLVLHCTINQSSHEADFIDSIHQFLEDWEAGLGASAKPV